ncbi:pyridoxal phosphate-dependent aminotransferase [Polaromonas sp.]|jgi:alanine-synthesizing transaminase|uniref:pyridoxal phosphate-dependent aminotransferase n=1 Tax=Polaromonas sp. TaxID=1869339 RepID=UPI001D1CE092|nr:pyridoxal phosphate-dependent aminotransferase [Polaromonas sp.]MBT9476241.1 pyridoxal phosphate-dependent aminotransferase [Polaromonas sp.]
MKLITKSAKLANVCYDIRGPIMDRAKQMEEEGQKIIKLNIGNLAVFGFDSPEEIQQDMIRNLPNSAGYSDSKGIFAARKAVMHETQKQGVKGVTLDDIYLGNGASELIVMATNALLNDGDELLVPTPDYPLWTAAASLSGGTPVHYLCDEANGWMPNLADIRAKITPSTRGIVVINPNNPTGALYSDALLTGIVEIAREHGLVIFADEVYDKVLYDGARHTALASLSQDVLTLTFNSLSKSYRSCGYRAGWMVVSGDKRPARDYIEGLNMLSNMRLCSNVPGQWAIQTALGGHQSINELVGEGGRLRRQRDLAYELITAIPGVSCVKPSAALYMFPRLDPRIYPITDDRQFFLELLEETRVMLVQGTGFNWATPDHFRIVFLPHENDLREAIGRIAKFLETWRNNHI